jgi:putative SbcD/Mre11-related phosphoesterase
MGSHPGRPNTPGAGIGKDQIAGKLTIAPGVVISSALCVYLEEPGAVIVADLHLGMEAAAEAEGAFFPRRQKPALMKRLKRILDEFRPRLFVIDGDFKHNFGRDRRREMDEVREVFDYLDSRTQVALTRGNHDNFLKNILPDEPLPRWTRVGDCFVCHGHQDLPQLGHFGGLKVLAHEHPALKLRDSVGATISAPAFVFDDASRTLVLPALGPLAFGTDVLQDGPRSVHLRRLDRRRFRIFAASEQGILDFGTADNIKAAMRTELFYDG